MEFESSDIFFLLLLLYFILFKQHIFFSFFFDKVSSYNYSIMGKAIAFSFIFVKVLAGILFFLFLFFLVKWVYLILRERWKTYYICLFKSSLTCMCGCDNGGNQCGLTPCSFQFPCHAMFWPAANFGLEEIPLFNSWHCPSVTNGFMDFAGFAHESSFKRTVPVISDGNEEWWDG